MKQREIDALYQNCNLALAFIGIPLFLMAFVIVGLPAIEGTIIENALFTLGWVTAGLIGLAIAAFVLRFMVMGVWPALKDWVAAMRARPTRQLERARERAFELARQNGVTKATRRFSRYEDDTPVIIVDVGILVYEHEEDEPHIARHNPLPLDAAFLRPYLQIWTPKPQKSDIVFELVDEHDKPRFRDQHTRKLRGHTGVVSEAWLPMQGITVEQQSKWSLRAHVDGVQMAIHHFEWGTFRWDNLKAESPTDGELSRHLSDALKSGQIDTISLDDLLEPQKIGRGAG